MSHHEPVTLDTDGRSDTHGGHRALTRRQFLSAAGLGVFGTSPQFQSNPSTAGQAGSGRASQPIAGKVQHIAERRPETRVLLYERTGDDVELVAATTTDRDSTGGEVFRLPAPATDKATLIARSGDWFTTRRLGRTATEAYHSLTLDHELLYGPETARNPRARPVGTVSVWRRVVPTDPTRQVLFVDVTAPGDSNLIPDITVMQGASFAVTLPEHVSVGYREGQVDGCREGNRPPACRKLPLEGRDSAQVEAWHPARGPQLPPFTLTDETYVSAYEAELEDRRTFSERTGLLGSLLFGRVAPQQSELLQLDDVFLYNEEPDATLAEAAVDTTSPRNGLSPNNYDTVREAWLSSDVRQIEGVTYQLPIQIDPEQVNQQGVTMTAAVRWTLSWGSAAVPSGLITRVRQLLPSDLVRENRSAGDFPRIGKYSQRLHLDIPAGRDSPSQPDQPEQPIATPSDYVTKTGNSDRGHFSITTPTTVAAGEPFSIEVELTEARPEQYGGFKIYIDDTQVASQGLGAGETTTLSFTRRITESGRRRLPIEVRFKNSDFGINERVGQVGFDISVIDDTADTDVATAAAEAWASDSSNYSGIIDRTDREAVTVRVGVPGNGHSFAFGPPALKITEGTSVTWAWTGEGGPHNVVANNGAFESTIQESAGAEFEHVFGDSGSYLYSCTLHESVGMKGAVVVI